MREWDEIAENLLPHYLGWLSQGIDRHPTMNNARYYITRDPILRTESAQMRDNIAAALHRLSGRIQ